MNIVLAVLAIVWFLFGCLGVGFLLGIVLHRKDRDFPASDNFYRQQGGLKVEPSLRGRENFWRN